MEGRRNRQAVRFTDFELHAPHLARDVVSTLANSAGSSLRGDHLTEHQLIEIHYSDVYFHSLVYFDAKMFQMAYREIDCRDE